MGGLFFITSSFILVQKAVEMEIKANNMSHDKEKKSEKKQGTRSH